jgi:hypothetical protein
MCSIFSHTLSYLYHVHVSNFAVWKYKGSTIYIARQGRFHTRTPIEKINEPKYTNPIYPRDNLTYEVNMKIDRTNDSIIKWT